jgi:hypothetical protein
MKIDENRVIIALSKIYLITSVLMRRPIFSSILVTLAVIIATITAEESVVDASATKEQCDSNGEDNATCTYKQLHSNDFTPSNPVKSETKTNIDQDVPINTDDNNNNKKQDLQNDAPLILPFP